VRRPTDRRSARRPSRVRNKLAVHLAAACCGIGLAFIALTATAALQDDQPPPYIGTPQRVVQAMLSMARVRSTDTVMDLGAGDGRIVLEAARRYGARAVGIEMDAGLVSTCQDAARRQGLTQRATCHQGDIFIADLSQATVLTLYLSPEFNELLVPRILASMRPGSRVVSHDFAMGAWPADAVEHIDVPEKNFGRGGESTIMLFIVPATARGRWRGTIGEGTARRAIEFSIEQQFQAIEGAVHAGDRRVPIPVASLQADRIRLELPDPAVPNARSSISARIEDDRMIGEYQGAGGTAALPFTARRIDARPSLF